MPPTFDPDHEVVTLFLRPHQAARASILCSRLGPDLLLLALILWLLALLLAGSTIIQRQRSSDEPISKEWPDLERRSSVDDAASEPLLEFTESPDTNAGTALHAPGDPGSNHEAHLREEVGNMNATGAPMQDTTDASPTAIHWHGINRLNTAWGWMA